MKKLVLHGRMTTQIETEAKWDADKQYYTIVDEGQEWPGLLLKQNSATVDISSLAVPGSVLDPHFVAEVRGFKH